MRDTVPLLEAHNISGDVKHKILEAFPDSEVIIHQDPEGVEEDYPKYH
jgi:ferrous-iron efflux pump FieF